MAHSSFRKATPHEAPQIWRILQQAIKQRKVAGSNQWQDGYPNLTTLQKDIDKKQGYVIVVNNTIIGYCALLMNDEPAYAKLKGKWLTEASFVVFHRVAISAAFLGEGWAKKLFEHIEVFAKKNETYSIKADTNYDNHAMLHLFKTFGYSYCGEVSFRGSPRLAYEKVLSSD